MSYKKNWFSGCSELCRMSRTYSSSCGLYHISRSRVGTVEYLNRNGVCHISGTGTGAVLDCIISIRRLLGRLWTVMYQKIWYRGSSELRHMSRTYCGRSGLHHIRRTGTGTVVDCRVSVVLVLGH